jgi:hypothetical protein
MESEKGKPTVCQGLLQSKPTVSMFHESTYCLVCFTEVQLNLSEARHLKTDLNLYSSVSKTTPPK